jgi:hypothetical protein
MGEKGEYLRGVAHEIARVQRLHLVDIDTSPEASYLIEYRWGLF